MTLASNDAGVPASAGFLGEARIVVVGKRRQTAAY